MNPGATTRPRAFKVSSALPRSLPAGATSATRPSFSSRSNLPSSCREGSMSRPLRIARELFSRECTRIHTNSFSVIFKNKPPKVRLRPKIQQQTNFDLCCPQIVQNLSFMRWIDGPCCFQFEQNLVINNKISFVLANYAAMKPDRGRNLPCNAQSCRCQFYRERLFIDSF